MGLTSAVINILTHESKQQSNSGCTPTQVPTYSLVAIRALTVVESVGNTNASRLWFTSPFSLLI